MRAREPGPARRALRPQRTDPHPVGAPRVGRGLHRRRLLPGPPRAARDVHLGRARLGEPPGRARVGSHGLLGLPGHHRQRADDPVQPRPVPGDRPALPGGHPGSAAALRQAQLPGGPCGAAAAHAPPGLRRHARRAARPRAPGRAAGRVRRDLRAARPRPRPVAARHLAPVGRGCGRRRRPPGPAAGRRAAGDRGRLRRAERRGRGGAGRVRRGRGHPGGQLSARQGAGHLRRRCTSARPAATAPTRPTAPPGAPT